MCKFRIKKDVQLGISDTTLKAGTIVTKKGRTIRGKAVVWTYKHRPQLAGVIPVAAMEALDA